MYSNALKLQHSLRMHIHPWLTIARLLSRSLCRCQSHCACTASPRSLLLFSGHPYCRHCIENSCSRAAQTRRHCVRSGVQGHLRLVLVPVLYNALADQPMLQDTPLFRALHRTMFASGYAPLVNPVGYLPDSLPLRQTRRLTESRHVPSVWD